MKISNRIMQGLALAALVGFSGTALARDLTAVGFGGAIQDAFRKAYFAPYAAEKGITVLEDTTNGGLAKQKAMVDAGNVTWDVMQMEDDDAHQISKLLGDTHNIFTGEKTPLAAPYQLRGPDYAGKALVLATNCHPLVLTKEKAVDTLRHLIKPPPSVPRH